MSVREYVYTRLSSDSRLNAIGFTAENIWHSQTEDQEPVKSDVRLFILITMRDRLPGVPGQRGPMRCGEQMVDFFVYTRDRDWTPVNLAVQRLQELADEIVAVKTGNAATDGYISTVEWTGETGDGYDEVYEAMNRIAGWNMMVTGA